MNNFEEAELVWQEATRAGLVLPRPGRHADKTTLQRGYSMIDFLPDGVRARAEGDGDVGRRPTVIPYSDPDWVDDCVDILRVGRTSECGAGVDMASINQRVHYSTVDYDLRWLDQKVQEWNLDPDYQREHVWSLRQRELFMGYLLENGRMPLIFLQDWGAGCGDYEVLDGKQRLTTCLQFVQGALAAQLSDGRRVQWADFSEIDRRLVPTVKCAIVRLDTRADVLRFYLRLNRGGTVHTDEEIDRVQKLLAQEQGGGE